MKIAVYPGSFDPITLGHFDIILRGSHIFDRLIVAVAVNDDKDPIFSPEERKEMIAEVAEDIPNVEIDSFNGLTIEYVKSKGTNVILRGIRTVSDFEYEFQMALTNRTMVSDIETVFVMTSDKYSFLSSRLIKETVRLGGDVSAFVPPGVQQRLERKLRGR
jgi:pantetheine-phosphate adenylyltransferase